MEIWLPRQGPGGLWWHDRVSSSLLTTTHTHLWFPQWQRLEHQCSHIQTAGQALAASVLVDQALLGQHPSTVGFLVLLCHLKDLSPAVMPCLPLAQTPGVSIWSYERYTGLPGWGPVLAFVIKAENSAQNRGMAAPTPPPGKSKRRVGEEAPSLCPMCTSGQSW